MRHRAGARLPDPARRRRRGRRRDRHAGAAGRARRASTSPSPPATRISPSWCGPGIDAGQHHERQPCSIRTTAVIAKFGVRAGPDRRLPRADGRQRRQRPRRGQVRAEDRGQVAGRVRHARRRDRATPTKIGGKIGENLRAALPRLPLNRELVTIKTDVPLELAARRSWRCASATSTRCATLYARYGFNAGAAGTRRRRRRRRRPAQGGVRGTAAGYARARAPRRRTRPIRRSARRASTKPCSRASSSTPGSRRLQAADAVRLRHRDRFARPDARATWSA